ncbi:MAG: Asp-tRNA(Asn)/Glu-tRNA(Gln) amidotransferase GatCAB subunit A [Dehalococcoidia bacterium]|nr:MAG: Asp-tRNA(Asn)/Glu-tRNA(Gln) amidotransferase GatCAB subunit A [Dehalococcoidia bacterium]
MPANHELCTLTLEYAAALVASKQVSPVELTEAALARIAALNPKLNAFMTVTEDAAREAARAAEREIASGTYRGQLHGIPIAVKDLFATKGVRTTAGSKILSDWVPDFDATVVTKLNHAGAVSLGKLGMHEWAFGTTSDNVHFGPVRNPWNTDHVPGGSSGGSGAATAAGLAFATLGSDTGGSIRIPAAACGCVGMMPTYGRASLYGAVPLSWSLDHPGPLTRSVRDAAIVLRAISGYDPLDPSTEQQPVPDWIDGIERGPRGLRIGVPKQYFWDGLEPEIERLTRKALAEMESAGAELREIDWPDASSLPMTAVMFAEASAYHAPNFPSRKDDYSPQVAFLLDAGTKTTGVQYVNGYRLMQELRRGGADAILEGVDVIAAPTMPIAAPGIEASRQQDPTMRMAAFTGGFDFTGGPAISVPCGLTSEGLPAGIMFAGRRWDEASVFRAGRAYEDVRGPFPAPPIY